MPLMEGRVQDDKKAENKLLRPVEMMNSVLVPGVNHLCAQLMIVVRVITMWIEVKIKGTSEITQGGFIELEEEKKKSSSWKNPVEYQLLRPGQRKRSRQQIHRNKTEWWEKWKVLYSGSKRRQFKKEMYREAKQKRIQYSSLDLGIKKPLAE